KTGQRRLHQPDDFVAIEIAAALTRDIRVIPVLVDGARMPRASELPDALKPLARRQAAEVRHVNFGQDAETLIARMRKSLSDKAAKEREAKADADAEAKRTADEAERHRRAAANAELARQHRQAAANAELVPQVRPAAESHGAAEPQWQANIWAEHQRQKQAEAEAR